MVVSPRLSTTFVDHLNEFIMSLFEATNQQGVVEIVVTKECGLRLANLLPGTSGQIATACGYVKVRSEK